MLLVQIVPFQLLIIPIYVMIVRSYGLADTYLGMILPFAINSTAVFIFRQFFLQLPEELFSAARLDGAGAVSYTHLRAHETRHDLVCRLLLEKKKTKKKR